MDLTAYPTEVLLQELNSRGTAGVASLTAPGAGRLEVWWGDRVKCLGLAVRLTSSINMDMDHNEHQEESEEDEAEEPLVLDVPQLGHGQYL